MGAKLPFPPSFTINIVLPAKQTLVPSSLLTWTEVPWEGGLRVAGGSMLALLTRLWDTVLAQLLMALFEM